MDAAALRAELEAEWSWRADEIRFLRNQLAPLAEESRVTFRKSLVVMLYSHFEGFCRAAFASYIHAVNAEALKLQRVVPALMASVMSAMFHDLRNPDKKSTFFRNSAADDSGLHRYTRDREFCERLAEVISANAILDVDAIVDTESNLKPVVLQKILFRLGLDPSLVDAWKGNITMLLARRNGIAHGSEKAGISGRAYGDLETAVYDVVNLVTVALFDAAARSLHLRSTPFP